MQLIMWNLIFYSHRLIVSLCEALSSFYITKRLYNKCWGNQRAYERKKNKKVEHIW